MGAGGVSAGIGDQLSTQEAGACLSLDWFSTGNMWPRLETFLLITAGMLLATMYRALPPPQHTQRRIIQQKCQYC